MNEATINSWAIALTTAAVVMIFAISGIYSLNQYLFYMVGIALAIGMKLAVPKIPFVEIVCCVALVFIITYIVSYLTQTQSFIYFILGEIIPPSICVFGFGSRWVKKGWLPKNANRWKFN